MKILAIDTGVTTGFAVLEDNQPIAIGTILCKVDDDLEPLYDLVRLTEKHSLNYVVIEYAQTPTASKLNEHIKGVNRVIHGMFPYAIKVISGTWKQCPRPIVTRKDLSTHEKDAIGIGNWYYKYVLKIR